MKCSIILTTPDLQGVTLVSQTDELSEGVCLMHLKWMKWKREKRKTRKWQGVQGKDNAGDKTGLGRPRLVIPALSRSIPSQALPSQSHTDTGWGEGKAYNVLLLQWFPCLKHKYSIWTSRWVSQFINSGVLHLGQKNSCVITVADKDSLLLSSLSQSKSVMAVLKS